MAVILDRIMGYQTRAVNSFTDLSDSAYYAAAVLGANAAGVLSGDGTTVRPTAPITRAEAVTIFHNAIAALVQSEGKYYNVDTMETVIVRAPGVQIKQSTIYRDLILAEGIGNGEVTLSNVTIVGNLIVRGGSKITLNNVELYGDKKIENGAVIEITHVEDNDNGSIIVTPPEDE